MSHLSISAVRADALFASALQPSAEPSVIQVRQAIARGHRPVRRPRLLGPRRAGLRRPPGHRRHPDALGTHSGHRHLRRFTATTGACRAGAPVPGALHLPCRVSHGRRHADRAARSVRSARRSSRSAASTRETGEPGVALGGWPGDGVAGCLGHLVELTGPARRVVSLVPSLTEAVAVSAPGQVMGATDWCTQPAGLAVTPGQGDEESRTGGDHRPGARPCDR